MTQKTSETKQAFTYLGYAEYHGETALYDGNDHPKCEGTVEEVVAYLRGIADEEGKYVQDIGGQRWLGYNGTWYNGSDAVNVCEAEISELLDGTHVSLRVKTDRIRVGDRVVLNSNTDDSGQEGKVTNILHDGHLEVDFDDGQEGCYSQSEVEVLE